MFNPARFNATLGDKIFRITDTDKLYQVLLKRKHWKQINPAILQRIFENAQLETTVFKYGASELNQAVVAVHRFIGMSEIFRIVEKYVELVDNKDPENGRSRICSILNAQGDDIVYFLEQNTFKQQQTIELLSTIEMSYQSAIVCDPLYLAPYCSLAGFYLNVEKKQWAAEICKMYWNAERALMSSTDTTMNYMHDVERKNEGSVLVEFRAEIDRICTEVGLPLEERSDAPIDTTDEQSRQMMNESVERTQRYLYPKRFESKGQIEPNPENRKESYCKSCGKTVTPTFHGACPNCGEFL